MSCATELLPITEIIEPSDALELATLVRSCYGDETAVYPIGGATSLDFGLLPTRRGVGLSLAKMGRIMDYPARDMTVTVEAGVTMKTLAEKLAAERQRLPIDVPCSDRATVGGVIATNFNGPRRYGQGTIRDHVIGISAVDGRGIPFKGGGRVVKNVAGYDFCKLLTGSLGTLGVITQITLKLKPQPDRIAIVACSPTDWAHAEAILAALVQSRTAPVAIELLGGPEWQAIPALGDLTKSLSSTSLLLVVAFEGTDMEVRWMVDQLGREWWDQGVSAHHTLFDTDAAGLMDRFAEFPAAWESPLVLRASVVPSGVVPFMKAARQVDSRCSLQAHAGSGIVFVRMTQAPAGGMTKGLIGNLQSAAAAAQGSVVVLSTKLVEATHQSVWGSLSSPAWLMNAVKREFDPRNILNPGRFVFS